MTSAKSRYVAVCRKCRWKGYRVEPECECYDRVCHVWAPGIGCPRQAKRPCPHCGAEVIAYPVRFRRRIGGNDR